MEQTCPYSRSAPEAVTEINGTTLRVELLAGKRPDPRIMRSAVVASLKNMPLFMEDED